jgi:hypothetical protein
MSELDQRPALLDQRPALLDQRAACLDQRPAFFTPDWQYGPLPTNHQVDNLLNTNQVTPGISLCSTLDSDGGSITENDIQSREIAHSALPTVTYSYAAGGLLVFPTIGNFTSDFTGPEITNLADITTFTSQPTGELQGWATQQPPVAEAWDSAAGPCFLPDLDLHFAGLVHSLRHKHK